MSKLDQFLVKDLSLCPVHEHFRTRFSNNRAGPQRDHWMQWCPNQSHLTTIYTIGTDFVCGWHFWKATGDHIFSTCRLTILQPKWTVSEVWTARLVLTSSNAPAATIISVQGWKMICFEVTSCCRSLVGLVWWLEFMPFHEKRVFRQYDSQDWLVDMWPSWHYWSTYYVWSSR